MLRPIKINPVLNGFVVEVGCQNVVFSTPDQLGAEIARFYKDPNRVEKEFIEKCVNRTMDNQCVPNPAYQAEPPRDPRIERLIGRRANPADEDRPRRAEVASLTREPRPYDPIAAGAECAAQCESPTPTSPG